MRKKLLFNLITLTLTSFLLILTMYSWYVSNREVSASGISARISDPEKIVEEVIIYSFNKPTGDVYGIDHIYDYEDTVEMRYDPNMDILGEGKPTMKLIEIRFVSPAVNLSNLNATTNATKFIGYNNQTNPGYITSDDLTYGLSLSSVIKFKILDNVSFDNQNNPTTATFSDISTYTYDSFEDEDLNGTLDKTYFNMLDYARFGINKIFVLMDFDDDSIDRLFSNNIGNEVMDNKLNSGDSLNYNFDFKFMIIGKKVE